MLVAFLIMLREGIEVALIIGIIASYTVQRGDARALPAIWAGMLAAALASVALGALILISGAEFPQRAQEVFEGLVAALAVVILISMVFWMKRAGRSMRRALQGRIDLALVGRQGGGWSWALALIAFLITGREGLESVMFLVAVAQQAQGAAMPVGAALGLVVAAMLGVMIFRFGVRINLARFFRYTGVFVILVAAGLAANVLHAFHEAGIWNALQQRVFDLSAVLPADGPLGVLLASLFGYNDAPVLGEVIVYLGFLIPALFLFLKPARGPEGRALSKT